MFLKTYNTVFDDIITKFTDQNGRSLEIEYKVSFALLINKYKWRDILYNQEQENMVKDMDCYHLREIFLTNTENNYWIQDYML